MLMINPFHLIKTYFFWTSNHRDIPIENKGYCLFVAKSVLRFAFNVKIKIEVKVNNCVLKILSTPFRVL